MQTQRVPQTDRAQLLKGGPLAFGTHEGAAPKLWVMNIDVLRRYIEITADRKIGISFFGQAIAQPRIPFELVGKSRRANDLTIGRIN